MAVVRLAGVGLHLLPCAALCSRAACSASLASSDIPCHTPPPTTHQVEAGSYRNIALSLGADAPDELLFATDNIHEARAAAEAGWQVVLADRAGNAALPAGHGFPVAASAERFLAAFR